MLICKTIMTNCKLSILIGRKRLTVLITSSVLAFIVAGCIPPFQSSRNPAAASSTQKSVSQKSAQVRELSVTATAYTARPEETNENPWLSACGVHLKENDKIIAVSRDLEQSGLTCGTKITISSFGDQIFTVQDRTAERWKNKIDIFMGSNLEKALKWGKRKVTIQILDDQETS